MAVPHGPRAPPWGGTPYVGFNMGVSENRPSENRICVFQTASAVMYGVWLG
ncbi:hypothetical protein HMPREF9123_2561 [Neisseria bacilliformis ATCC BAA-1200]|uniref:Uncharacterized protein n=1 Tax=Neisseria bacilliformis ATCC BAA-1200 TaxID=888742 RepID=F2BFQ4_9NEIS|nr:hypothetical protein HMPREF9123_2561 [Neisseria bacilliformis ATCC BAA-1200]